MLEVGIVVCLFVYWVLIRGTTKLNRPLRRKIVLGYLAIHLTSWGMMHAIDLVRFRSIVRAMYADASVNYPHQLGPRPHYQYRVRSFSPIPFVLVATEKYSLGPLWGLGMRRTYFFTGWALKLLTEEMCWIS